MIGSRPASRKRKLLPTVHVRTNTAWRAIAVRHDSRSVNLRRRPRHVELAVARPY